MAREKETSKLDKLPSGGEFSPGQIDLRVALAIVQRHAGNREAAKGEIRAQWFSTAASKRQDPAERLEQQLARADNVIIGMMSYGLFDSKTQRLTSVGEYLLQTKSDDELHAEFARHILSNNKRIGLTVVQAVLALQSRRERVSKASLAIELERYGIEPPRATTHHLVLLNWLRKAGVLVGDGGYRVDEARAGELAGIGLAAADEWAQFTTAERAFLRTLRQLAEVQGTSPFLVNTVLDTAEATLGPVFKGVSDRLRDKVFRPLAETGWIKLSGVGAGRGGKGGFVGATEKLLALDLGSIPPMVGRGIPADLRAKLNTPLDDIYRDLDSDDKVVKGIALELLAIRIASELNLTPTGLRVRGRETGGAEVDLIAQAVHLHFSRWLFQCKNTPTSRVPLSDLARELGMCVLLKAHVIVMVTTGTFSSEVKGYAESLASTTSHQVVLVDKEVLRRYRVRGGAVLLEHFQRTAADTMRLKQPQLEASGGLAES